MLKNSPFTWFDELTTGFDKHVLSQVEGLRANGACVENIDDFPFMLSLSKREKSFFSNLLVHPDPKFLITAKALPQGFAEGPLDIL